MLPRKTYSLPDTSPDDAEDQHAEAAQHQAIDRVGLSGGHSRCRPKYGRRHKCDKPYRRPRYVEMPWASCLKKLVNAEELVRRAVPCNCCPSPDKGAFVFRFRFSGESSSRFTKGGSPLEPLRIIPAQPVSFARTTGRSAKHGYDSRERIAA